ncbi:MAG: FAD:protein FMN transferase [Luteolibacter sp.]
MKRWFIFVGSVVVFTVLLLKHRETPAVLTGRAMGCEWKLLATGNWDRQAVHQDIAEVLEHWEQVLSTWRKDSDLCRYNRGQAASPDLEKILKMAEALRQDSRGAFDHRLLAELTAAGFGPGGKGVDLSSLGKGVAVDAVCERLRRRGIHRHIFSLAGEVRAGEGGWPVEIENPNTDAKGGQVTLSGNAMATSGNYRQWNHRQGDKLASHILNPTTGQPVLRPPCGVTVIGPDAAMASGWATALFVLGPEGNAVAEARGYRVIWTGRPN